MMDLKTRLPGGVEVSTVEMPTLPGFDLGYRYETMVFQPGGRAERDCRRYQTREEAEAGHDEMVTVWTGWTPDLDETLPCYKGTIGCQHQQADHDDCETF